MRALAQLDAGAYLPSEPTEWVREPKHDEWVQSEPAPMFQHIAVAFQKGRHILDLEADWDEAGSPPISRSTWTSAVAFVVLHAALLWVRSKVVIPPLRVLAGPGGSIDLHWRTGARELLINIPAVDSAPATFYGDDFGSDQRRGSIEPGNLNVDLLAWLTITD